MESNRTLRRSSRISKRNEPQKEEEKLNEQQNSVEESSLHLESGELNEAVQTLIPLESEENTTSQKDFHRLYSDEVELLKASCEKLAERQMIFNENLKNLNEISRNFGDELQLVKQSCERLWEITTRNEERFTSIEMGSRRLERHLELTTAQTVQRIEDNLDYKIGETVNQQVEDTLKGHQHQVEESLKKFGNEFSEAMELQGKVMLREIEKLKRRVEEVQNEPSVRPITSDVSNHRPFGAKHTGFQSPATSTAGGVGAFNSRQAIDVSDDFMGMEEFGEDLFMSPESRRVEYDRRNSLGGGSIFNAILAPVEASNTYMISSVTRESYSHVVLREITLESVGPFMNQYLNIKRKHPGQAWMIVDFCSEYVKQELTVLADTYDLPGAALGLGGAFALTDRQVLFLILEKLKAKSLDDFVTRLQSMRFLEEDSDLDFTKQYNFEKLFRAALSFRFRFVMQVQLLGSRANAEHIPPLHKMGQTPGLLNYFFDKWPAGTGKSLFSRHFTPEMRAQTELKGFLKLFFAKINTYRDVKQGYDDLGSVLSSQQREKFGETVPERHRDERTFLRREGYTNPVATDQRHQEIVRTEQRERKALRPPGYEASKKLWTPERERREFRPRMLNHVRGLEDNTGNRDAMVDEWVQSNVRQDLEEESSEEQVGDENLREDNAELLNAMDRANGDAKKGCYYKYMYGECTNKGCTMDHSEELIQGMWKKRVWELAKAAKSPGGDTLVAELQRALRDAQASTNSNTRT